MCRKLPERFVRVDKYDRDCCRCKACEKVRATCRYCELCKDCCSCTCDRCSQPTTDCQCELCAAWPAKGCLGRIDRDTGNYEPNLAGGCDIMLCDKCHPRHVAK